MTRRMLRRVSPLLKDRLINVKRQSRRHPPHAAERRHPPRAADVTFHANFGAVHYKPEKISKTDFQMQHLTIYHLIVIGELNGVFFFFGGRGRAGGPWQLSEQRRKSREFLCIIKYVN